MSKAKKQAVVMPGGADAATATLTKQERREMNMREIKKAFKRDWQLYLMLLFPVLCVVIFKYAAYPGLRMVFMDYIPAKGYEGSEWVGLETFRKIFTDDLFWKALKNSLIFNVLDLIAAFPVPIILALMLNELRFPRFKKITQTLLYLPHFLSWVIVASLAYVFFKPSTGLVNVLLMRWGIIEEGIPFLNEKWHWAVTYVLLGIWQGMGWNTIIYLAAITGINGELYEAATVDGANRWQKMWNITLPGIKGTTVTLLIMQLGRIMGSNFERLDSFGNTDVKDFQYQLAIYIYQRGLAGGKYSRATAVNLFQSMIGMILVILADKFAKALGEDGLI